VTPQSNKAFAAAVSMLSERDPTLAAIVDIHGVPDFWHRPPGFSTMVLFILEQQVSLASAAAAFSKLASRLGEVTPSSILRSTGDHLRADGFSRQKTRYVRELAQTVLRGDIDLDGLSSQDDNEVRRRLINLVGIGPWTADVYLLSCLRRPDIWPVQDRALQVATFEALSLPEVPQPDALRAIGERWRPHRSTAARLLWHSYLRRRGRKETAF